MTSPAPHPYAKNTSDSAASKQALAWLHTARFYTTAAQLEHLPPPDLPEIAFVGRSNAGKSTAINTLTQQKRLAFASKTPGRTQHINLFALGRQQQVNARFADLPGYGYASVPKEAKWRWQQVMVNYLQTRPNLHGIVLLIDPRHGLTELDDILLDVMRERVTAGLNVMVLLTKADKLTRSEGQKALSIVRIQAGGASVRLFSSTKRTGVAETAVELYNWCHPDAPIGAAVEPSPAEPA
ncbi:ribosome biogenesis GTP-binding protein YihA/YsxC [Saezia sanguinis]|uniref:ribosome biogenesis GTP-binding protein YihA/YsxC n=1 Tax=Saezia sanguinis TaxID=1965230 RepID=UPI00305EACE9